MMIITREEFINIIKSNKNKEFLSEISYYTNDIDEREYAYDEGSALFDLMYACRESDRNMLTIIRKVLIEADFYRVMTQDEIDNTYRSDGRVAWEFKMNKLPYTTDETVEEWQWPSEEKV